MVLVGEALECAGEHLVTEEGWLFHMRNPSTESLLDAKVNGLKLDFVIEFKEPVGGIVDYLFFVYSLRLFVQRHVAMGVEGLFDR